MENHLKMDDDWGYPMTSETFTAFKHVQDVFNGCLLGCHDVSFRTSCVHSRLVCSAALALGSVMLARLPAGKLAELWKIIISNE